MADGFFDLNAPSDVADLLLIDVARKIQLTPTDHKEATRNYQALGDWVDGPGSVLEDKVIAVYASGSFGIGAPILGQIKAHKHDVDAVVQLDLPVGTEPAHALSLLYEAIRREPGTRYYDRCTLNSRCVTVEYADGRTVDLMPVVRLPVAVERVSQLFHWKDGVQYHKEVNPKGFVAHFRGNVRISERFGQIFDSRLTLLEKAETEQFPEYESLERKAPRVVALQLMKRARDIAYRPKTHDGYRRPPSVVLAALALEAPGGHDSLSDELLTIAGFAFSEMEKARRARGLLSVQNPSWTPDIFTDRWPENPAAQDLYLEDLDKLIRGISRLKTEDLGLPEKQRLLKELFGETAAQYAVEKLAERFGAARGSGRTSVSSSGRVGIISSSAPLVAKRTPFGGES